MKKRVFIIHGWEGYPEEGWFPWLKRQLESCGFEVFVPQLSDAANPRIYNWVPEIEKAVDGTNEATFFVGHSIGCQAIARYLEKLPDGAKAGGSVFVAGFFKHLEGLEGDPDVVETDKHWLLTPIDLDKTRMHLGKSIAIFSDDDPWVPLDNQDDFKNKLGSEIIIEHAKGHYSGSRDKCFENPSALQALLKIAE